MKILRFLLGYICGMWSLLTFVGGFFLGIGLCYTPEPSKQTKYDYSYQKRT